MWYKWSQTRSISCTNLISLLTSIQVCPIPIQNNVHCGWIEVKESPKYKLYDNIKDLPKTIFWYHSNDTKRNPWVMLSSHCPISGSSRCLRITVYLAVMFPPFWKFGRRVNHQQNMGVCTLLIKYGSIRTWEISDIRLYADCMVTLKS